MLLCQHVNKKESSLLSICPGNLSQIAGGIRLTHGKEIHAKIRGPVQGICILYDTFCNGTAFCPTLEMVLVKPVFSRYFRKFLVTAPSTEMTKGCINSLLSLQLCFISMAKVSYFLIFSASILGRLWVKGITASQVLFYSLCQ